jgi:radical SAM-linked protein
MIRVRITFAKTEWLRYIGHLDMHYIFIRTFRRANLAVVHSQGFHPQPKIHLASALSLGHTGSRELIECWLADDLSVEEIEGRMKKYSHPGIRIIQVESVPLKTAPLQVRIDESIYSVIIPDEMVPGLAEKIKNLLDETEILVERKGKHVNIRPWIHEMTILNGDEPRIIMRLQSGEGTTGKVDEVLRLLDIDPLDCLVNRDEIFLKEDPVQESIEAA